LFLPPTKAKGTYVNENISTGTAAIKAAADTDLACSELAAVIRTEIQKCQAAWSNALDHAMSAGGALLKVQPKVHAAGFVWKRWVKEHCFIGVSTAELYMQFARHRDRIEAERQRGVELSLRAARRLIAAPRASDDSEEESEETMAVVSDQEQAPDESLTARWRRATEEERATFLDSVGVDAILSNMSPAFVSELRARVPAKAGSGKKVKTITLPANPAPTCGNRSRH
jgi:hypothetical protein